MANNPFLNGNQQTKPAQTNAPVPGGNSLNDNFELDLTNVESTNFTIPEGLYKVKCIDVEQSVSKGGNPMFSFNFEVVSGEHAGFKSKLFAAITPSAIWKIAEIVQSLGVGAIGQVVKFKKSDVIGKECGAKFAYTEYNGNTRSQITQTMTLQELNEMANK